MQKRTNLLTLLRSLPPERLVEGAQIEVTKIDGTTYVVTMGPRHPAPEPFIVAPTAAARA